MTKLVDTTQPVASTSNSTPPTLDPKAEDDKNIYDDDFSDYDSEDDFDNLSFGEEESMSLNSSTSSMGTGSAMSDTISIGTGAMDTEIKDIARREVRAAWRGRFTAILVLLLALGVLLPISLHRVAKTQQNTAFQDEFDVLSDDLMYTLQKRMMQIFLTLDTLAVGVVLSTDSSTWPFVTISDFSELGEKAQRSAGAIQSSILTPIVIDTERSQYEEYVQSSNQEVIDLAEQRPTVANSTSNRIFEIENDVKIVAPGPGPYYPIRHAHPTGIGAGAINYNLVSNQDLLDELPVAASEPAAVVGRIIGEDTAEVVIATMQPTNSSSVRDLFSAFIFPVPASIHSNRTDDDTIHATISAIVSWRELLASILPSNIKGVFFVIEDTCGQVASLRIDGREVEFLGFIDVQNKALSEHKNSYTFKDFSLDELGTFSFPVRETCRYDIHVYPSTVTEAAISVSEPLVLVGVSCGFFLVTLCIFLIYDRFLERRNRAVLGSAVEARAIVSSLFPANVRDRLFETTRVEQKRKKKLKKLNKKLMKKMKKLRQKIKRKQKEETKKDGNKAAKKEQDDRRESLSPQDMHRMLEKVQPAIGRSMRNLEAVLGKKGNKSMRHPKHELKSLLAAATGGFNDQSEEFGTGTLEKPIADLFPNTTVVFADIVGFTAWSSEREPQDVFLLLQTIYHAFDKLAKRRGVFKVETIGDCYVAVTGLPEPQADHAVRMVKFSREIMAKMSEVTKKLDVRLGPDTSELSIRIGVNSGPVTAGVLQGAGSRFQLFGDTMNYASRMESTGEKGRIQISKSTADLLVKEGRSYWVKPRKDLVHAKGKGNVQTFWLVSKDSGVDRSSQDGPEKPAGPRRAPPRSVSTFTSVQTRGVRRTTSDSVQTMGLRAEGSMQSQAKDGMRQERLIQWQVELFSRLLLKIVAARDNGEFRADEAKQRGWEGIAKSSCHSTFSNSFQHSLTDLSIDTNDDGFASTVVDIATNTMAQRDKPCLAPPRRASTGSNDDSFNISIGTYESLNDPSKGVDETPPVSPSKRSIGGSRSHIPQSPAALALNGAFTDENFDKTVIDEVAEIITLPKFNMQAIKSLERAEDMKLSDAVTSQLRDYISTVSEMYRDNPFHCFEHACHVTMATNKFLNRIVIPENVDYNRESSDIASDLHAYTYGITSDPLTQFAIVFSALVHDVDHTGVPNGQLAKENSDMAEIYRNTSLAEQNSVDLAWDLFMDPRYKDLQDCIAASREERQRFRQLLVNCVMATDIFEPTMKELRNKRWEKAFHKDPTHAIEITDEAIEEDRNMKATIVIEHIIQASDVAHCCQHWHIYQKWNERLFQEMYSAYECGRAEKNPAESWYKGELWFFDNYVIPLAKKLEECNVFGVASAECLDYATANRNEWSVKGEEVVGKMIDHYRKRKFLVGGLSKKRNQGAKKPPRRMPLTESSP